MHMHFYFSTQGIVTSYQHQYLKMFRAIKIKRMIIYLRKKRSHAGSALTFKLVARWKLDKSPSLKVGPSIEKLSIQSILKSNVIRHVL